MSKTKLLFKGPVNLLAKAIIIAGVLLLAQKIMVMFPEYVDFYIPAAVLVAVVSIFLSINFLSLRYAATMTPDYIVENKSKTKKILIKSVSTIQFSIVSVAICLVPAFIPFLVPLLQPSDDNSRLYLAMFYPLICFCVMNVISVIIIRLTVKMLESLFVEYITTQNDLTRDRTFSIDNFNKEIKGHLSRSRSVEHEVSESTVKQNLAFIVITGKMQLLNGVSLLIPFFYAVAFFDKIILYPQWRMFIIIWSDILVGIVSIIISVIQLTLLSKKARSAVTKEVITVQSKAQGVNVVSTSKPTV